MLQGGCKINHYHRLRVSKQKMKKHYAKQYSHGNDDYNDLLVWNEHKNNFYINHGYETDELEYWNTYNLTGPRQFAKDCTNSKLRAMNRVTCHRILREHENDFDEDFYATIGGADYQKYFDYLWTLY